jgi:hypothetical protein
MYDETDGFGSSGETEGTGDKSSRPKTRCAIQAQAGAFLRFHPAGAV